MKTCILGGGPAGLSAGFVLAKNNQKVEVFEKDSIVGGLSKTIERNGFRFDMGGHRFWTKNDEIDKFVKELMGDELIKTPRISRIYFNNRFFDYPLKPVNALLSLGVFKATHVVGSYLGNKVKGAFVKKKDISFEDWITNRFGKKMYEIFFKNYTEKVWGIPCSIIAAEWAAQRIKGMSLRTAVKEAFFKSGEVKTLIEEFYYPKLGTGRVPERLAEEIIKEGSKVEVDSNVVSINHKEDRIDSVTVEVNGRKEMVKGDNFISSIPITELIENLNPRAPEDILDMARRLAYRDIVLVNLMLDRETITNDTWIYIQEQGVPFGRLQQPKNWSKYLVPEGKSSLIVEYFSSVGDKFWNMKDDELIKLSVEHLQDTLKFIKKEEVFDGFVIRIRKAYPTYEIGYEEPLKQLKEYLKKFKNLQIIGRYGIFRYNNMDHSIEMGIKAAKNLLGEEHDLDKIGTEQEYQEVKHAD